MKLSINKESDNYCANIVQIKEVFPIKDADNIVKTIIFGNSVIISKQINVGDIVLYFNSGTQLSEDFCKYNNLYSDCLLNLNTNKTGYFSHQRRVKAINLKKTDSDGIILPLNSLDYLPVKLDFKINDQFTSINDIEICKKYIVKVKDSSSTKQSSKKEPKVKLKDLLVQNQFKFHNNTPHFAKNLEKINTIDTLIVTRKYHGSSGIVSNVLVKKQLSWLDKLLLKLKFDIKTEEYGFVYSSGKPKSELPKGIESKFNTWKNNGTSFYKDNLIWIKAYEKLKDKTEKGITLYFEIVGQGIQGNDYTYGFEHEIFVYRITSTNVDGKTFEFSWKQVKDYCNKFEIKYVQEYEIFQNNNENLEDVLNDYKTSYLNKSYPDCKIDEGICVRIESTNEIFKLKSPKFLKMESDNQEKEITNIEDEQ